MFRFKKFELIDDNTPMKIGMDSVILGSWANGEGAQSILDVGSGCGILSFMLSQRYPDALIKGIEIFKPAFEDAMFNLAHFPSQANLSFINKDFRDFRFEKKFDLIVSNPPYFVEDIKPLETGRLKARFDIDLTLNVLVESSAQLLSPNGRFTLIYDVKRFDILNNLCLRNGLYISRKTIIKHSDQIPEKRVLIEFQKSSREFISEILIIKNPDDTFTDSYRNLTKEFYLQF